MGRADTVGLDAELVATLHHSLGILYSDKKTQVGPVVTVLGIQYHLNELVIDVAPQRRTDLLAELRGITNPAALSPGAAAKLKGKLQFVASHYEGRYGRSFLQAFAARQQGSQGPRSDAAIRRAVAFWVCLLERGAATRSLAPCSDIRTHGLLFTDGYAPDPREAHPADPHIRSGWVYFDLLDGRAYCGSYEPDDDEVARWSPRVTQVVMAEMLAPVIAVSALAG